MAKGLVWAVSRMQEENNGQRFGVGGVTNAGRWRGPISGRLSILQALADGTDTLTTVINRFVDISKQTGQKESVWANHKCENVIFHRGNNISRTGENV